MSLKIRFRQLGGMVALAAIAGLAGLWLGAQPAHAQTSEPPARVITRPDLAYPTPEMVAEEARSARDEVPARAEAARPQRSGTLKLPEGHPWVELPPAWPALPQGVLGNRPDRYAPAGPSAPLAGNFVVNSTADTNLPDSVLTLREALLVANGAINGPFTAAEQAQLGGCSFSSGYITSGCGANIQDSIFFAPALGFRPVITLSSPLPPISDTRPTLLLGAFLFNNVQPVINAQNLTDTQPGLVVQSNGNTIAAVSVISAPGPGIRINGNENTVGYWTMARNNAGYGIHIAGLTNTVESAYIGVFSNTVTNDFDCAGNGDEGIFLAASARATTIRKNIIACNTYAGVFVSASSDNLIGGSTSITDGNIIARNLEGIYLSASGAQRNRIQANFISVNDVGVLISAGRQNTITAGLHPVSDTNTIRDNVRDGIRFESGAAGNLVANAQIYLNGRHGVNLVGSGTATNTITRTFIVWNNGDGIRQDPNAGPNFWREMAIAGNGGLGIDIDAADHTSDVPNPPYVFVTSVNPATGLVQGKANGTALLFITIVDLYRIHLDPSGFGEGYEFVGSATTDSFGNWSITDPNPSLSNGCYTAVVRGVALVLPYATEFSRSNCSVFAPIVRKP